jgi:hypothetical protein
MNALDVADQGKSFYGGGSMAGTRIKMSSRTVIGILAGQITTEQFQKSHKSFAEHFARMLRDGRMLKEVRIESTERDDDWVEFLFSDRDPAISPFKLNPDI